MAEKFKQYGISYTGPKVFLLKESGLGVAEFAARTCYDSFEQSENESISNLDKLLQVKDSDEDNLELNEVDSCISNIHGIEDSELLNTLAWVYHHHSILEHATLSYLIKGTSRGVLQEHARHRLQGISVRSTRYTMSPIINAFVASITTKTKFSGLNAFIDIIIFEDIDFLILDDIKYITLELTSIYEKLNYQYNALGLDEFLNLSVIKDNISTLKEIDNSVSAVNIFKILESGKKKRNIGDPFKHIISDNWKVDMVVTFNIRSLKNYFDLRDSGAAWFQIQWLARAMKKVTPKKYLKLIDKKAKEV